MESSSVVGPINIPEPTAMMGPFDLAPLWSCVTQLCSGPCETHHAIGNCADWSQNLSGGVIAPLARARSVSHSTTRSMAPKTAAQQGFWHMIWIHHERKSVSYGAREIWEAGSIFSNLRCSVGFVICLFSAKLDCNKILLTGEAAAEVGHGNTAVFFVCGNMHCTCYVTRSNTEAQARVHDTHMCTQFRQRFTAFFLLWHCLTLPLFHLFFLLFSFFRLFSHMEPAGSQADYVQVSLLCPLLSVFVSMIAWFACTD